MHNLLTFPLFSIKKNGSSQRFRRWNDPNPNHDTAMAGAKTPIPQLSESDKERFFAKVSKTPTATGCLEWTACKNNKGYGMFQIRGRLFLATRVIYFLHYGIDPRELCVMHSCDNPICVNPLCLLLGTQTDNMQDMHRKGRGALGEKHPNSKLTAADIPSIRSDARPNNTIAECYGVGRRIINLIKRGERWKHIA